jgi:glycosyltransferase involved in cell wall biosynthesis
MRLLLVYPYVPYPLNRGTYHRVFNLARELARHHEVDLFCLSAPETREHLPVFSSFCRRVHFQPFQNPPWPRLFPHRLLNPAPSSVTHWSHPGVLPALLDFATPHHYGIVHFCDLVMWQYIAPLHPRALRVMDRSRVDLLFQTEELNVLNLGAKDRLLRRENLWKLARYERNVARSLAATVVCGPDDEKFSRAHIVPSAEIKVLPNGVDESFFDRSKFPPEPAPDPTILFCGAMDYSPNVSGLQWYFRECDPFVRRRLPLRRVLIVGKNPVPEVRALVQIPGVTVTGEVPDVRPYYQQSWVQMVPLLIGGGTRLKIVESLCLGTPVVSTTIGAQGLDLSSGEHLLLADQPTDFAAALGNILTNTALRSRLAEAGRAQVLAKYTWRRLGLELSSYYSALKQGAITRAPMSPIRPMSPISPIRPIRPQPSHSAHLS